MAIKHTTVNRGEPYLSSLVFQTRVPASITTAGAVTYTAAQVLGGMIARDPSGADRTDVLPTAAQLAALIPGVAVGTSFDSCIMNMADFSTEHVVVTFPASLTEVYQLISSGTGIDA